MYLYTVKHSLLVRFFKTFMYPAEILSLPVSTMENDWNCKVGIDHNRGCLETGCKGYQSPQGWVSIKEALRVGWTSTQLAQKTKRNLSCSWVNHSGLSGSIPESDVAVEGFLPVLDLLLSGQDCATLDCNCLNLQASVSVLRGSKTWYHNGGLLIRTCYVA